MQSLLKLLESAKSELRALIENREATYEERTEKWQEGEKGEADADRTVDLDNAWDSLDNLIDTIRYDD